MGYRLAIILLCAVCSHSCADDAADGAVYLTWKLGALTCDEASVEKTKVSLYDYADADPIIEDDADCMAMSMQLNSVAPGDYTFVLDGLNSDGCITHQGRRDIQVPEGRVLRLENVPLLRRQRDIRVQWNFENLLDCQGNGVHQVEIRVVVADLFDETHYSLCEGFQTEIRKELPLGEVTLTVRGLDTDGNAIARGSVTHEKEIFLSDPCRDMVEVRVPLTLCDFLNCEGE
jgi:hypothetical protein